MLTPRDIIDGVLRISRDPWKVVPNWQMVAASIGVAWLFYFIKTADDGFIFLDHVNLVFHEAGHPIFGMFGSTLGLYGGTLGQLTLPVVVWMAFWRQRDTLG